MSTKPLLKPLDNNTNTFEKKDNGLRTLLKQCDAPKWPLRERFLILASKTHTATIVMDQGH